MGDHQAQSTSTFSSVQLLSGSPRQSLSAAALEVSLREVKLAMQCNCYVVRLPACPLLYSTEKTVPCSVVFTVLDFPLTRDELHYSYGKRAIASQVTARKQYMIHGSESEQEPGH